MEATARSHPDLTEPHEAPAVETASQAAVDWTAIARLIRLQQPGRCNILETVVESFRRAAPTAIDNLENAISGNALEQVSDIAHSLKSSSATLGAMHLVHCFNGIESAAAAGDAMRCRLLFQHVRGEFIVVVDRLASYVQDAQRSSQQSEGRAGKFCG